MKNMKQFTLVILMTTLSGCISIGSKGAPGPQGPKGDSSTTTVIVPEKN